MSHPTYNAYGSGNQGSNQGQYGLSYVQTERDPRRTSSHLGPGSSISTAGTYSATSANTGGMLPLSLPQSMNFRHEQNRTILDENKERSVDINRAREETRLLGKPMTSPQMDELFYSGREMVSYPMPSTSASLGHRHSDVESGSSSLGWSSNYKRPAADDPSNFYSSSAPSAFASSDDSRFNASSERERDMQSIPGLGDFDYPVPDRPAAPTESSKPKYTSESASTILLRFGLEKEDLEHLISYPEDQITPASLPFILRQIRIEKTKRAATASQSKPCLKPQPTRSVSGMDGHSLSSSGEAGMRQEEISSAILQPRKVIDYGHTGKYTGGVRDEIGGISSSRANSGGSGSTVLMNTYDTIRPCREPLQKNTTEVKSSALGSSHEQTSSVSSLSSSYSSILSSVAPPSSDQTKRLQTHPNQAAQKSSFSPPKKDTDIRALKSKAPLNEPEADRQSLKNQPPNTLYRGVHPSRPGLVVIGSNEASCTKDQSKTQGPVSTVVKPIEKQQPKQQTMKQAKQQPKQEIQKQLVSQTGELKWPPVFSAAKSAPPASHIPSITDATQRPVFIPGGPHPIGNPPAVPQPIPNQMNLINLTPPPSKRLPAAQVENSKGLPTASMMQDFAATPPRIFPHTCSLCYKECTNIKDWISHQSTSLHLENCNLLQRQYPEWDGQIPHQPSAAGKDAKPSPSTSSQTSKHRQKKIRRSHSPSPHRHHDSKDRRGNRSSRSRSPWSDRPTSTQYRSRSPERRLSPRTRDEKWPSTKKRGDRRSPPRRSYESRSPKRRSYERLSPLRMGDERPRRSDQRALPSHWSDQRASPPRRTDERRSPPKKSNKKRSPPRRSNQRRSPQRKKSSSAETLAKSLLETSALESLSNMSDLEAVVKTLAPALLAELARLKSSSLPPSSSSSVGRRPTSSSTASSSSSTAKKLLTKKPSKAKPSLQKTEASSSTKPKDSKQQKKPPQKKPAKSSVSTPQTTSTKKALLPTPNKPLKGQTSVSTQATADKLTDQKSALKGPMKAKVKNVSTKQKTKMVKTGKLPAKAAVMPDVENSKPKKSKTNVQESVPEAKVVEEAAVEPKHPTALEKASDVKVAGPMEIGEMGVEATRPVEFGSCAESQRENPTTPEAVSENSVGKTTESQLPNSTVKTHAAETSSESKSTAPKNLSKVQNSKAKESKTSVQESVPKAKVVDKAAVGEMGVGSNAEGQRDNQATTEALSENSADKISESQPPSSTIKTLPKPSGSKTKKLPPKGAVSKDVVKQERSLGSKSTAPRNPPKLQNSKPKESETKVQESVPKAKTVEKAVVEPKHQAELNKAKDAKDTGPVVIGEDEVAKPVEFGTCAEGQRENQSSAKGPETNTEASPMQQLTVGERIEHHLKRSLIACHKLQDCFTEKFATLENLNLLIFALPVYHDGLYTEDDFVKLLEPFGFQYPGKHQLYVFPQTCMAFVCMLDATIVTKIINAAISGCNLKRSRIFFQAIHGCVEMQPFVFYKWLMAQMGFPVVDDGAKTILIKNISSSEIRELREVLTNIQSVKNYMPLLNKVFIEFESLHDADQLGVWYSLLEHATGHEVHRLNVPNSGAPGPPQTFWVTMRTSPFLFPTASPCFTSPDHLTVRHQDDIEKASGSMLATVMLTGLPEGNYAHEDVAKLVWRYFPKQNLHSLYYNVVVLPLQRRAFVFFADWTTCCDFVRDHIKKTVSVNGCELQVHFVLQHMGPESSEEAMYTTMMKWSNPGVPEPKSLEERLLCVEVSETSVDVVRMVVEVVASIATCVSYLPLANRICIEMTDSRSVTNVVENYNSFPPNCPRKRAAWTKVQRVESLKSLKVRLRDSTGITISFGPQSMNVTVQSPAGTSQIQPALQTSGPGGSTAPEPVTAGPSATAPMKDNDPVTAVKTQIGTSSASKGTTRLTIGEEVEKHLLQSRIICLKLERCLSQKCTGRTKKYTSLSRAQLFITNLPQGRYTEEDLATPLRPFGFEDTVDSMYVVPQTRMAFVSMPKLENLRKKPDIYCKNSKLAFYALSSHITATPLVFYMWLMKEMRSPVGENGERIVLIKNISPSETGELREALRKIQCVKNFLPLLNKVFIEFEWFQDADRLGVWYSLLKRAPAHQVHRLKIPCVGRTLCPPKLPESALPDCKDAVVGAIIPPMAFGIPEGSFGPCWVMMRTSPFLFPTMSPWFIIPDYLTVRRNDDIKEASDRSSTFSTVMLTGLPGENYTHEDVAKLVWKYFPKQNLHSLYYNVVVLTLQRRAFVFFPDWTTCCSFVQDHIKNPVSVKGSTLSVHFVLQDMGPKSSEEMMYATMMKWSNAGVPEQKSLEERLLYVEISETSLDVIRVILEVVASIATFVSFLPLANRICIEMADSSSAAEVVEKYNTFSPDSNEKGAAWSKVKNFELLQSLKQRLKDSEEISINLELDTSELLDNGLEHFQPIASKTQTEGKEGSDYCTDDIVSSDKKSDSSTVSPKNSSELTEPATSQEDSLLVQDGSSLAKQLCEGDAISAGDESNKDPFSIQETSSVETGSKPAPMDKEDGKKTEAEELKGKMVSEDVKNPDGQIANEDQPLPDPDGNLTEQETFEILDSIDDHTATEDDSQNVETPSEQISKEDIRPMVDEEEDTYQVIDFVEDQSTITEIESGTDKRKSNKRMEATDRKDVRPSKRSSSTTTSSKSEEEKSPKKPDRTEIKKETRKKVDTSAGESKTDKEFTEEMMYEIVDSIEDEQIQDFAVTERNEDTTNIRLTDTSEKPEEATYKIIDSVEDETVNDEPTNMARSTRGKRERTTAKDASNEKTKREETPTKKRHTPARESQEQSRAKKPRKEEKEQDATFEVIDSVEYEVVQDDRLATRSKGKSGRPRKDSATLKKSDKDASEEEVTYQILDSVEEEMVDDQQTKKSESLAGSPNHEEEEEPMYQIVDSLEEDQAQEEFTATKDKTKNETQTKEETLAEKVDAPTCGRPTKVLKSSENVITKESHYLVDVLEESNDDPSVTEESCLGTKGSTSETDIKKEDESTTESQTDSVILERESKQNSPEKCNTSSALGSLDEVSEEEENYPEDVAEEEELKKRKATAKEKQFAKEQEVRRTRPERRTRDREEREHQGLSSSRVEEGGREGMKRTKERGREEKTVEVDAKELVTLDEVGADEPGEERASENREYDEEMTEAELQALVTLDEFVEEEDDGKTEQSMLETCPANQKQESADFLNPEGQKDFTNDIASSDSCVFDEQNFNMDDFVTVDEVGDEVGDKSPKPHSSSSTRQSSRARRERQSSSLPSPGKRTSTRPLKESKSSASSSSSSSRSNKGSSSSSFVSPKKSKDSSEPTKSPTKTLASTTVSKASSSYPVSTETPSASSQNTQESNTEPPAKASNTASFGCSTRSSSTAHETEEKVQLATAEASIETHPEPLGEDAQDTQSAVAKSDHKVPAEDSAAKSVELVTKIETPERHPPLQGHGLELNQAQSLEIDCSVRKLVEHKKGEEKGKEDDVDEHPEVEEEETYHILDSLDDQTDEPMNDVDQEGSSEAQPTGSEEGKKACPEEYGEMEMGGSFQVLDSVTEDKAATGQEDSNLVQDDSSKEDTIPVGDKSDQDSVGKDQVTDDVDNVQDPRHKGDEKTRIQEEVKGKMLSTQPCKASKDVEIPDNRILNEDQPLEDLNNKDALEDSDIDVTEQDTFEILDSIEDQTEEDSQTLDTPSEQISIEDIGPMKEEEDTYQVIDSLEDQPTPTETESETDHGKINIVEATARQERPSERSGPTTTLSKSKKFPKKQDRTVKKYETPTKMDTPAGVSEKDKEFSEEMEYEIVDSVEDDPVQDAVNTERCEKRKTARAKKESQKPEEASYEIIDSVEDDTAHDEPAITARSTRGKRESTTKKDEDMPTRRRHAPVRESQQRNRDNTPKKEAKTLPKESTPSKKSDNVSEVIEENIAYKGVASVEDVVIQDDQPATRRQGKKGGPKKDVKSTKNDSATLKKGDKASSEKEADEEEATFQILDSLEDEMVDDQTPGPSREERFQNDQTKKAASPKNEDEEEPIYQIVDSLEDDQAQEEFTGSEDKAKELTSAKKEDTPTCVITVLEASEKMVVKEEPVHQVVDNLEKSEGSASGNQESIPEKNMTKEVILERENKQKTPEKDDTISTLANLEEVSDEEEDYPDDVAEEEELKKRQATAKRKQLSKRREASRTRERPEREPRSRSSSSSGGRGGSGWGGMRRAKETVEVDAKELVKLDEVGADETKEDRAPESQEYDGDLQTLVTLDEFVEEEEDGKAEQSSLEESVDFFNLETMVTLDEAGDEEEKPDETQAEETLRSAKRKHDDETEESMNFVTVDEVGEVDEEEEKEAVETRIRGQAKKRTRQTPVRKSTRGKQVTAKDEKEEREPDSTDVVPPTPCDASLSLDKDLSTLSSDGKSDIQKTEAAVDSVKQAGVGAGKEAQPEKSVEEEAKPGRSRADIKVKSKQRRAPVGPEAKQSRSQSPSVSADNILGQEFVVPKSGYFCNLCSIFYLNESTARDLHCNSQRHQDNLKKHYQKLQQKP